MTDDEIMAIFYEINESEDEDLESFAIAFARAIAAAEREACAKVCEAVGIPYGHDNLFDAGWESGAKRAAAAIRARSET